MSDDWKEAFQMLGVWACVMIGCAIFLFGVAYFIYLLGG